MTLRIATAEDRKAIAPVLAHGYGFPESDVPGWLEKAGKDNVHVFEEEGGIVGSLLGIPMGQFFGGRAVPTLGVAGVSIAIPRRAKGAAARMMTDFVRMARQQKFAISTLYPATVTLYQRAGYERAGQRLRTTIDLRRFDLPRTNLRVEEHAAPTEEAMALYRQVAQKSPGYLDRGPYVWRRVREPRGMVTRTFTFRGERRIEGYVVVNHTQQESATKVTVVDAVAATRAGGQAIWSLLGGYQSVAAEAVVYGGTEGLLHALLPERHYAVEWLDAWMIRICDPLLALKARGYPPVSARVTFLLSDAALPENSGAYALVLSRGKPTVKLTKSEKGVRLTERGLAALYTGFLSPWELRRLGMLECTEAEADLLSMLFAGRAPSMPDMF
jgi:predicted acetyltransferase